MKYYLFLHIDDLSKNIFLQSYLKDGFEIVFESQEGVLIRKSNMPIVDENRYIQVLNSYIKRSGFVQGCKGKIIDLTDAFLYAYHKNGFDKFDNKFEWYIRNIIIRTIHQELEN